MTDDLPPLEVREPRRRINRKVLYQPTVAHPHYYCKMLHRVHHGLVVVLYMCALDIVPTATLVVTGIVLMGVYAHHLETTRTWSPIPALLSQPTPNANEHVVAEQQYVGLAHRADIVYAVMLVTLIGFHFYSSVNFYRQGLVPYVVLTGGVFISWLIREFMHASATVIRPKYDD